MSDQPETIDFDDFSKIKMRVGKIIEAGDHPKADKLLVLKVDLGDEQRQLPQAGTAVAPVGDDEGQQSRGKWDREGAGGQVSVGGQAA